MLKKYYGRLVREGVIKAVICGGIAGFTVGALIMAASWIATAHPAWLPWLPAFNGTWPALGAAIGVTGTAAIIFYFAVFRPTMRDAARRVDALGLEERAITMLAMEGNDHYLAKLQRADTAAELGKMSHKRVKLSILKIPAIIASVCLVCMTLTVIIPNAQGVYAPPPLPPSEQEIIDQLLEDLREEIENAEHVKDEVKDELHEIVDRLETDLNRMETTDEKVDAIKDASDRIHEIIQKEQTHHQLGEALKEFENTEELGEAIQAGDTDKLQEALENIEDKIHEAGEKSDQAMKDELKDLADSMDQALEKAGQEGDPLTEALKNLSEQLKDAAEEIEKNNQEEAADKTEEAIEDAKEEMGEALGAQMGGQELEDEMQATIESVIENLKPGVGIGQDGLAGSDGNGQMPLPEDQPPEPGNNGQGNGPENPSGGGDHNPEYDRYGNSIKDGETPYTDEFDKYFKEEMARLENDDLTDAERELIARYFASMMVEKETN